MSKKLILKRGKVPLKICLKLSFKNMWKKKFRYIVMLLICALSLTFLSFTIELNGEKLRQNVYTMIENGYRYTEVFEHVTVSEDEIKEDFYNKYASAPLKNAAYSLLKEKVPTITLHDYALVDIDYVGIDKENNNYFYTGKINTIIKYDPTNDYELVCGRLPKLNSKEILVTDYIIAAFDYFKLYPSFTSPYDYLNLRIDLTQEDNYIITGIVKTNYEKWTHFANIETVKVSDKENYSYTNDFIFMNSVILNEEYFKIEKLTTSSTLAFNNRNLNNAIAKWNVKGVDNQGVEQIYEPDGTFGATFKNIGIQCFYDRTKWRTFYFGNAPQNDDEIVIPSIWVNKLFGINWTVTTPYKFYDYATCNRLKQTFDDVVGREVTLTFTNSIKNITYQKTYKICGISNDYQTVINPNTPIAQITKNEYQNIYYEFNQVDENILVQLPNNSENALKLFNETLNAGFVLNVFAYKADIEGYEVDPFIALASKVGLFVFAVFTMGIMWTIISIEIVDSKKEIGILRSIGLSSGKVSFIFIFQTAIVIILSYFIANFASYYLIPYYNNGITDELGKITLYMYTYTTRSPIYLGIFVVVMTFISTLIPLLKIMNKKIIDVISERDN